MQYRIKCCNKKDRERLVLILVNLGYIVRVVEIKDCFEETKGDFESFYYVEYSESYADIT